MSSFPLLRPLGRLCSTKHRPFSPAASSRHSDLPASLRPWSSGSARRPPAASTSAVPKQLGIGRWNGDAGLGGLEEPAGGREDGRRQDWAAVPLSGRRQQMLSHDGKQPSALSKQSAELQLPDLVVRLAGRSALRRGVHGGTTWGAQAGLQITRAARRTDHDRWNGLFPGSDVRAGATAGREASRRVFSSFRIGGGAGLGVAGSWARAGRQQGCGGAPVLRAGAQRREFHASRPRRDVFFLSVPMVKQGLLLIVRFTLILLPFFWRWGFFRRFPVFTRTLWQLPLFLVCIVLALGIHQSPKTARWKLLLMSEREEMEWSTKRFEEIIATERVLILPPSDPRVQLVHATATRLIQSLEDDGPVSAATFPREDLVDRIKARNKRREVSPSARTDPVTMPFRPESSNPEKLLPSSQWDLYVMDLDRINAYVLPSTDIFVYSGLLQVTGDDESLLAAVLAHEISHVTERHSVESLGFLALSGVVFDILRGVGFALTVSFPILTDALSASFNFMDSYVSRRAYSRKLETEADVLSLELMARAGYDPRAALQLWEIFNELEAEAVKTKSLDWTDKFANCAIMRTHPSGEERLAMIEKKLPAAIKLYERVKKERGQAVVERVQASPADVQRTAVQIVKRLASKQETQHLAAQAKATAKKEDG